MNFDFLDEQRLLRDQARRFLEEKGSPAAVREGDTVAAGRCGRPS